MLDLRSDRFFEFSGPDYCTSANSLGRQLFVKNDSSR